MDFLNESQMISYDLWLSSKGFVAASFMFWAHKGLTKLLQTCDLYNLFPLEHMIIAKLLLCKSRPECSTFSQNLLFISIS